MFHTGVTGETYLPGAAAVILPPGESTPSGRRSGALHVALLEGLHTNIIINHQLEVTGQQPIRVPPHVFSCLVLVFLIRVVLFIRGVFVSQRNVNELRSLNTQTFGSTRKERLKNMSRMNSDLYLDDITRLLDGRNVPGWDHLTGNTTTRQVTSPTTTQADWLHGKERERHRETDR